MALKITTHYKQALTSQMLNDKVKALAGSNGIINGFEINRQSNTINIAPGKCIISGAIIESDEMISIQIPIALQDGADIKVVAQYVHNAKAVNFYVYSISQEIKDTELVLAKLISQEIIAKKMRGLADLTTSLKAIKESVLADQELEYEGEHITSKESVDDATAELTIKGQTILNVSPIKDEVEVYADLQAAKNSSVKFDNTGDGIIDGINIKGKTYQNLLQGYQLSTGTSVTNDGIFSIESTASDLKGISWDSLTKKNSTYTVIINVESLFNEADGVKIEVNNGAYAHYGSLVIGPNIVKITTKDQLEATGYKFKILKRSHVTGGVFSFSNVVLLEGDHTANPNLPGYFEGIKGVGDKSRNLFDGKYRVAYIGGSTTDSYHEDNNTGVRTAVIKCKPNTSYTVSKDIATNRFSIACFDKEPINGIRATSVSHLNESPVKVRTFVTDSSAKFLGIYVSNDNTEPILQIEESSIATPYEKHYDGRKIEIKSCGKNLFNCNWVVGSINQSNGLDTTYDGHVRSDRFIEVLVGKTYVFSNNGIIRGTNVFLYDSDFNFILYVKTANRVTIPYGVRYMKLMGNPDNRDMFQVEERENATAYEPYKESIITHYLREPLMSLPNGVCDEIVGGKVIKRVDKLVLDGTENWGGFIVEPSGLGRMVCYDVRGLKLGGALVCDKLIPINWGDKPWESDNICISALTSHNHIYIYLKDIANIDEGKAWLTKNPTTVYYELAEPITTPLDNDVVLPNGAHDKIIGDKAIRNIGQLVLDGSESWYIFETVNNNDTIAFAVKGLLSSTNANGNNGNFISDKLKFKDVYTNSVNNDGMLVHLNEIRISVLKSRLETQDVVGFKKWLSQNPTRVWYELVEPYETPADNNIVLPNGVRDEIVDGKILRKVGKIVLDSDKYVFNIGSLSTNPDMTYFMIRTSPSSKIPNVTECNILSDKLETVAPNQYDYNKEMIYPWHQNDQIYFHILKSRLEEVNTGGFGKWLQKNPVTLWYELAKPYYETVKTPKLNSYKSQTNILGSTLIPAPLNIESYGYRKEALIKPSTKYTIHFNNKFSDENFKDIKVDLGGAVGNVTANNGWLMLTLTTPATLAHNELRISGYGIKVSNVMCNEGDEYREFVDGLASVGDKSKNLFNVEIMKQTALDSNNGSTSYRVDRDTTDFLKIKPLTTYIVSGCTVSGRAFYDKNMNYVGTINGYNIFTTPYNAHYFRFSIINDSEYNVQVEEGNMATLYKEHYNGHGVEICSVNKNLFDGVLELGGMDGNGILDQTTQVYRTKNKIMIRPSTEYIYSCNKKIDAICYYDKNDKFILRVFRAGKHTTPANAKFIRIEVIHEDMPIDQIKLQVEQANVSASYTLHRSDNISLVIQEPLRSLPNGVCDTIEKIDGQYVIVRRCGEVILDGSEVWNVNVDWDLNYPTHGHFHTRPLNWNIGQKAALVDRFIYTTEADRQFDKEMAMCHTTNSGFYIFISVSRLDTPNIPGFKKWLSQNPTTVVYELDTPTTHPLDVVKLPNGVTDTVKNGKRIRKIGKVVLDGSEAWKVNSWNAQNNTLGLDIAFINNIANNTDSAALCDRFTVKSFEFISWNNDEECISFSNTYGVLGIRVNKSKLKTPDAAGFKAWLKENPTTVWYELATPTEEEYIAQNINLDTYKDTTHILSTTKVPAVINAKIPTNIGATIKNDVARIEAIEDLIDKVMLPQLVQSHYEKTLLEFDYSVSKMLK